MRFKDKLVRCGACGKQFVYTVREQRRRAEKGLPLEAPAFCEECRGADVRLAEADGPVPATGAERDGRGSKPQSPSKQQASRKTSKDQEQKPRGRRPKKERPRRSKGQKRGGSRPREGSKDKGGRKPAAKRRGRKRPRQTDLRFRYTGTVKWFDGERGYGFIAQEDGEEVFVHCSAVLSSGDNRLEQGTPVEYEVEQTERGLQAVDVVPLA